MMSRLPGVFAHPARARLFFLLLAMAIALTSLSAPAWAATITVTTTADELDVPTADGTCSLREAVVSINEAADRGGCAATVSPDAYGTNDRIVLDTGTYGLQIPGASEDAAVTGDLDLGAASARTVTIAGEGSASTIVDANDLDRVFDVRNFATVRLEDLTVRNGTEVYGGGIFVDTQGALTLERAVVADNRAANTSAATFGGGIVNLGSLSVVDSTVRNNIADRYTPSTNGPIPRGGYGGGIYHYGTALRIEGSTISRNRALPTFFLSAAGEGGGVFLEEVIPSAPDVVFTNSTISANEARLGGGVLVADACFTGDTLVWTETGPRPIETILPGDRVWGKSETTGAGAWASVEAVHPSVVSRLLRLELGSGSSRVILRTTDVHPIWVAGRGWAPAGEIRAGDSLLDRQGQLVAVAAVVQEDTRTVVYDLTVEGLHTYYVSDAAILVHNK